MDETQANPNPEIQLRLPASEVNNLVGALNRAATTIESMSDAEVLVGLKATVAAQASEQLQALQLAALRDNAQLGGPEPDPDRGVGGSE